MSLQSFVRLDSSISAYGCSSSELLLSTLDFVGLDSPLLLRSSVCPEFTLFVFGLAKFDFLLSVLDHATFDLIDFASQLCVFGQSFVGLWLFNLRTVLAAAGPCNSGLMSLLQSLACLDLFLLAFGMSWPGSSASLLDSISSGSTLSLHGPARIGSCTLVFGMTCLDFSPQLLTPFTWDSACRCKHP